MSGLQFLTFGTGAWSGFDRIQLSNRMRERVPPVADDRMDGLLDYLTLFVEPTFADYQRNPQSARHAFLTCVAIFHCVYRATYPKSSANLRKEWGSKCVQFLVVEVFAHRLKHVRSDKETHTTNKPGLPLSVLVNSMDFHKRYFAMRDVILFIRREAESRAERL